VSENYTMHYGGGIVSLHGSVTINNGSTITQNATTNNGLFTSGAGIGLLSVFYSVDNGAAPPTISPTNGVAGFSLTFEDSTLSDNVLTGGTFPYGGGIYGSGYGSVVVNDSTITGNRVDGGGGARGAAGFFYGNDGSALASGVGAPGLLSVNITNTMIDGNTAAEESGGFGFRSNETNPIEITITDSTISNNVAMTSDGAAGLTHSPDGFFDNASLTIVNTTMSGNSSAGTGGAFYAEQTYVSIIDSTIDGNTAALEGGGFFVRGTGLASSNYSAPTTRVIRSTISNNVSGARGGGAFAQYTNLLIDNSTISGNSAVNGGGIFSYANNYTDDFHDSLLELRSSTVTNNAANQGGGIYAYYGSISEFHNSIISGNTAATSPDILQYYSGSESTSTYYSLVGDGTGSMLVDGTNGSLVGDAMNPIDALLGLLANNGGNTLTHLPMSGSPAIDAGDPLVMGGVDQTGGPRVNDGRIDMGSVETGDVIGPDFNGDGTANCDDVNALTREINSAVPDLTTYDIFTDGVLNDLDLQEWLIQAGARAEYAAQTNGNPFFRGDANLDGVVDGLDFITWNNSKFEAVDPGDPMAPHGYCDGDFNGDNVVDGLDFIGWNNNKFKDSKVDPGAPNIVMANPPGSTMDLAGQSNTRQTGRRELLVKGGRRSSVTVVANGMATTELAGVTAKASKKIADTPVAGVATQSDVTQSAETLAVHQVQDLSDSVSHVERQMEANVDRIFAGL
jgi:hypothetical protein